MCRVRFRGVFYCHNNIVCVKMGEMIKAHPRSILFSLTALIGCSAVCSLIYLGPLVFNYLTYTRTIPVAVEKIEIVELRADLFVPKATYTYGAVRREEFLETMSEKNPYVLEQKMREWDKTGIVGYANRESQCTLQKCFPIKQSIYSLILITLTLYFLFIAKTKLTS